MPVNLADLDVRRVIVEGGYPAAPAGCGGTDPLEIWPMVEARLGYGIGTRRVRYLLSDPFAKVSSPKLFLPPPWWSVVGVQEATETVDDDGEPTGEFIYLDSKARKDGTVPIRRGRVAVVEAEVDGVPVGIREAVTYALIASRMGRV